MPTPNRQTRPERVFYWAKEMFASPTIQIIIAAVIALAGFGGGWGVKGWKDGATVAQVKSEKAAIESRNVILETANSNCATDIEGVKKGMAVVIAQAEEREKAASVAMKAADLQTAQHTNRIKVIKALKPVPAEPDAQCTAMIREQIDYVAGRENGD